MRTRFESAEAFYADDERRRHSPEADYGVMWRNGARWPQWRVSYVGATGEVYALQLAGDGPLIVLGVVEPTCDPTHPIRWEGPRWTDALDALLDGWAELEDSQLGWVRNRLATVGALAS